jgi:hypothetical protein
MLTAVKLVDQWQALERRLPEAWESVSLRLATEQPDELSEAARILGPMNVGRVGSELAFTIRRAGGPSGPEGARRLFARLDSARIWCELEQEGIVAADALPPREEPVEIAPSVPLAEAWDRVLAELPRDWSDLLCALDLDSSALLARAALLTAPLNPSRAPDRVGFTFRCGRRTGYGVAAEMARRSFERLDAEGIRGRVEVLRAVSDADNVATQGPVWYVGGKVL